MALLLFLGVPQLDQSGDRSCSVRSAHADSFDLPTCQENCRFQYNIKTERDQTPILPFDTQRRLGYEKCMEQCDRKFYGWDDES